MSTLTLYSYWRSSSTWRVRLALAHKGVSAAIMPVHLVREGGEQHGEEHVARNAFHQIPTIEIAAGDGFGDPSYLSQSMAIMEWLEETYPDAPSLFPSSDPYERALTRQLAEIINSGTQPFQNLSVIQYLRDEMGVDARIFCRHFIEKGLEAYQASLPELSTGTFSMRDEPTMADFFLVPQLYNARRFKVELAPFERLLQIEAALQELEVYAKAHPDAQPDFDPNA